MGGIAAGAPHAYSNGEHYLLSHAPFYKRRYVLDGDIVLGCTIGCRFCYYRWIDTTRDYIGTGRLRLLASPETAARFVLASRLFLGDRDGIMLSARSDASQQIEEVTAFLRALPARPRVFVLHRGYFGERQLVWRDDERVVYCSTLTPLGRALGWTPIDEARQLEGIRYLLEHGVPPRRISIEVGPINERNADAAAEIVASLNELGLEFATYRGASVGSFGLPPDGPEADMRRAGFLTAARPSAPPGHEFYRFKNVLSAEAEEKVRRAAGALRLHRFTGTLYRDEFGMAVAYNRHNRVRPELGPVPPADGNSVAAAVERFGYRVLDLEPNPEGGWMVLTDRPATEDVAMAAGALAGTAVIFRRHRPHPTMDDIDHYRAHDVLALRLVGL